MKDETKPDHTAFPIVIDNKDFSTGMTIRQYFAAKAMQGYMASSEHLHQEEKNIADYAVRCADALIERLNK